MCDEHAAMRGSIAWWLSRACPLQIASDVVLGTPRNPDERDSLAALLDKRQWAEARRYDVWQETKARLTAQPITQEGRELFAAAWEALAVRRDRLMHAARYAALSQPQSWSNDEGPPLAFFVNIPPFALWAKAMKFPTEQGVLRAAVADFQSRRDEAAAGGQQHKVREFNAALARIGQSAGSDAAKNASEQENVAHSEDFRSVRWFERDYTFTATQAACVKALWQAWRDGAPEIGEQTVLERVDSGSSRIRDIFDKGKHPAWGTMLKNGTTRGSIRLCPLAADPPPTLRKKM